MEAILKHLCLTVSKDNMSAQIDCTETETDEPEFFVEPSEITKLLNEHHIKYGIQNNALQLFEAPISIHAFPIIVATGTKAMDGKDGSLYYYYNRNHEINRSEDWNFRDVMYIPSVDKGERLVTINLPEAGKDGMDVYGNVIPAKHGKAAVCKAGKNVVFRESDRTYYAAIAGQLCVTDKELQIHPLYEVNDTLSMKEGNLDFIGSIRIHGDVPSGYQVKAKGDITIFGMVEAATIIAGGSITISEGFAGLQKGRLEAGQSIYTGYINQGSAHAEQNLYVENSILHSTISVKGQIFCQQGHIIGGKVTGGVSIEVKDAGNRMNTKTEIILGLSTLLDEKKQQLVKSKKELDSKVEKLTILGKELQARNSYNNPQLRIMELKQKNSLLKVNKQIQEITQALKEISDAEDKRDEATLIVRNNLYANVRVGFGKYQRNIDTDHHYVQVVVQESEIKISPLY